jgi:threonine synthase
MTGERYEADQLHNLSRTGPPFAGRYDLEQVRGALTREALAQRPQDMWRWRELLPVRSAGSIVSLGEAATPMVSLDKEAARLGLRDLLVKDEGRLPTGSFKARGLVMAVAMAKELGRHQDRHADQRQCRRRARRLCQPRRHRDDRAVPRRHAGDQRARDRGPGARVYRVDGLIDECGAIVGEGAKAGHWFDMSTLKEPYRIEGKKTMGLELVEQLGWQVPDVIFYPTGGGTGLIGMWKAFAELEALGLIGPERPRMVAVQAEGCAPMVRAWERGEEHAERWEDAHTSRPASGCPRRWAIS